MPVCMFHMSSGVPDPHSVRLQAAFPGAHVHEHRPSHHGYMNTGLVTRSWTRTQWCVCEPLTQSTVSSTSGVARLPAS